MDSPSGKILPGVHVDEQELALLAETDVEESLHPLYCLLLWFLALG